MMRYEEPSIKAVIIDAEDIIKTSGDMLTNMVEEKEAFYIGGMSTTHEGADIFSK